MPFRATITQFLYAIHLPKPWTVEDLHFSSDRRWKRDAPLEGIAPLMLAKHNLHSHAKYHLFPFVSASIIRPPTRLQCIS